MACAVSAKDFTSRVFLVPNKKLFSDIRSNNFSIDYLEKHNHHFPEITNGDQLKATWNACLLIFHLKPNGSTHRASEFGFSNTVNISSLDSGFLDTLQVSNKKARNHYYSIISLSGIYNKITSNQKLKFELPNKTQGKDLVFHITYSFFPGEDEDETIDLWYGAYSQNSATTRYYHTHRMVNALRDPMYLSLFPIFQNFGSPYSEEKAFQPYIMEGNFSMPFTLMQGRDDQSDFLRASSVSVDPEFVWRITTRESAPLLPLNTKVGVTAHSSKVDKLPDSIQNLGDAFKRNPSYKFGITTYSFQIKHYSNGQEDSATYTQNNREVPNFNSGNFSVNLINLRIMRSTLNKDYRQVSYGGYAQLNVPWVGYEPEQKNRYGYLMVGGTLLFKTGMMRRNFFEFNTHHPSNGYAVKFPSLTQNTFRIDFELSTPTNEYLGYENNPFRFMSIRVRYINEPLHNRSLGWFSQLYYGRDYLNIRYNLVTFSAMFGLTFRFNKEDLDERILKKRLGVVYDDYNETEMKMGLFNKVKK